MARVRLGNGVHEREERLRHSVDHLGASGGALRHAGVMQVRRRPLWITFGLLCPLILVIVGNAVRFVAAHNPTGHIRLMDERDTWAYTIMLIGPIGAGRRRADRDRRAGESANERASGLAIPM